MVRGTRKPADAEVRFNTLRMNFLRFAYVADGAMKKQEASGRRKKPTRFAVRWAAFEPVVKRWAPSEIL